MLTSPISKGNFLEWDTFLGKEWACGLKKDTDLWEKAGLELMTGKRDDLVGFL